MNITTNRETVNLEMHIQHAVYGLSNDLRTRKAHPTYGITKGSLRSSYDRLVGLLAAHRIVTAGPCASTVMAANDSAGLLGWDLADLRARIDAA